MENVLHDDRKLGNRTYEVNEIKDLNNLHLPTSEREIVFHCLRIIHPGFTVQNG